jgi:transposase
MPAPLPPELRERVVAHHKETGDGRVLLGRLFRVGSATAYRWITQEAETGTVTAKVPVRRGREPKIPDARLEELRALVDEKSDRTLDELCTAWCARTGVLVDDATMHRALVRANLSLKKRRSGSSTVRVRTSSKRSARSAKR